MYTLQSLLNPFPGASHFYSLNLNPSPVGLDARSLTLPKANMRGIYYFLVIINDWPWHSSPPGENSMPLSQ